MLEQVLSVFTKLGGSLAGRGADWALEQLKQLKRPRIELKRAPENVFSHLPPGTSLARVREVLGTPHREDAGFYSFRFSDALIQVGPNDRESVESISVVIPQLGRRTRFPVYPLPLVLGKATLGDVLKLDPEAQIKKEFSSKYWCFWTESYFGFPGLYRHYLFGVMEAPCAQPPEFEWDHENERLKSDPNTVRVNWAAVSANQGAAETFNFWAFV